jgi:predicted flap endonuclease-1-like 5' DNA nuclease
MAKATTDLQQLKGIGRALAQRLKDAGIESFDGIVESGAEGLKKIRGIKANAISSILDQAEQLSHGKKTTKAERIAAIKGRIGGVREKVQHLAEETRVRFHQDLEGKCGKKLAGDLARVLQTLDRMNDAKLKRLKGVGRGLDKAEKRMDGLKEGGLKKVRKGLKKARKTLLKALP